MTLTGRFFCCALHFHIPQTCFHSPLGTLFSLLNAASAAHAECYVQLFLTNDSHIHIRTITYIVFTRKSYDIKEKKGE